jgi:phosphohistidine swiveling domain-containing protein
MGFMGLLKTEWKAHVFRRSIKKGKTYSASKVFQNWEFIFHYFRLYCLLHRKSASRDQFVNFLSSLHSNTNKKSGAQEHLKIASWLRENEDMPWLEPDFTSFTDTGLTFIGRGIYRGKIGEKVLILTKLSPDLVYSLHNVDVILTESASLLSHGLLAAVEKKILVVIGFTTTQLAHYEEGTQLILDFDHNKIELP